MAPRPSPRPAPSLSAHHVRGRACYARGDLAGALECYERALATHAEHPELLYDLARVARDLGNFDGAEMLLRQILELQPPSAEVANALALVLAAKGDAQAAIATLDAARIAFPREARLVCSLASLHHREGDYDKAQTLYTRALELAPNLIEAHANLALVHAERGDHAAALPAAQRAVQLAPKNSEARFNLATIRLALGDFAAAWPDYEARFTPRPGKSHGAVRRPFDLPTWRGQVLGDQPLLLWGEQGIGEEILFAALIAEARKFSSRVSVECDGRLVPLLARSFPGIDAVARTDPADARLPRRGVQCAMGSLCGHLRTEIAAFRGHSGYLLADAGHAAALRARYRAGDDRLIGVSWRTSDARNGAKRTTQLADWLAILRVPGVRFVNLQYGDTAAERAALERDHAITLIHDDSIDPLRDLDAQAAQIAALDGVITVQNATMYLANAVGAKVWALLPFYRDWRWPIGHATSPWLPAVRPLVQDASGGWSDTIARVSAALAAGEAGHG